MFWITERSLWIFSGSCVEWKKYFSSYVKSTFGGTFHKWCVCAYGKRRYFIDREINWSCMDHPNKNQILFSQFSFPSTHTVRLMTFLKLFFKISYLELNKRRTRHFILRLDVRYSAFKAFKVLSSTLRKIWIFSEHKSNALFLHEHHFLYLIVR